MTSCLFPWKGLFPRHKVDSAVLNSRVLKGESRGARSAPTQAPVGSPAAHPGRRFCVTQALTVSWYCTVRACMAVQAIPVAVCGGSAACHSAILLPSPLIQCTRVADQGGPRVIVTPHPRHPGRTHAGEEGGGGGSRPSRNNVEISENSYPIRNLGKFILPAVTSLFIRRRLSPFFLPRCLIMRSVCKFAPENEMFSIRASPCLASI